MNRLLRAWWRRRRTEAEGASPALPKPAPEPAAGRPEPSIAALAHIGDAVFDLHVRVKAVESGASRGQDLHRRTASRSRAAAQAATLKLLWSDLTPGEQDVARRGRNAHTGRVPKGATSEEYHLATAFEALLGHLFLAGRDERLAEILEKADRPAGQP